MTIFHYRLLSISNRYCRLLLPRATPCTIFSIICLFLAQNQILNPHVGLLTYCCLTQSLTFKYSSCNSMKVPIGVRFIGRQAPNPQGDFDYIRHRKFHIHLKYFSKISKFSLRILISYGCHRQQNTHTHTHTHTHTLFIT